MDSHPPGADAVVPADYAGQENTRVRYPGCRRIGHGLQYLASGDHGGGGQNNGYDIFLDSCRVNRVGTLFALYILTLLSDSC